MSEFVKKRLFIIYSSETGTSEDAAVSFFDSLTHSEMNELQLLNSNFLEDYSFLLQFPVEHTYFLFYLSTSGDGEVPRSFKRFWSSLLRRSLSTDLLKGVQFACFGFGDSSYEKYNACARKFFVRLKQLGASSILDIGLGDDQGKFGHFPALNQFQKAFLAKLSECGFHISQSSSPYYGNQYSVTIIPEDQTPLPGTQSIEFMEFVTEENIRLTESKWHQDIRLLRLANPEERDSNCMYESGDVVAISYRNCESLVARAVSYFGKSSGWPGDSTLLISPRSNFPSRIPSIAGVSFSELFRDHLEVGGIPRPSFFRFVAFFCADSEQKEKLLELSSPEGIDLYYQYCLRERRCYIDVLEEFPAAVVPLHAFLEACPKLIPRKYSIASAPSDSGRLELCVAVAEYSTPFKKKRYGLCSSYLSKLQKGEVVRLRFEKGLLSGKEMRDRWISQGRPVLFVGPGTGIAPIRSLIWDVVGERLQNLSSPLPLLLLFYGCRKRAADFLFEEEWQSLVTVLQSSRNFDSAMDRGGVDELQQEFLFDCAFSRETETLQYVTHRLKDKKKLVYRLLVEKVRVSSTEANSSALIPKLAWGRLHRRKCQTDARRREESSHLGADG